MKNVPLMVCTYPRAILHLDADAFFASVEQVLDPSLRNKPVVTGKERGIIACANYLAKAHGIRRGITLAEARRLCPELRILPNDYEAYGLYSRRIFNIIRSYTPAVEEYSVDEAFADITGVRRVFRCSYEEIALKIQERIRLELGITVSVGLSISKALAKICSKFRKPSGFTAVPGKFIHVLLQKTPLEKVWGIGPNTVSLMNKLGLRTAYDFVLRQQGWATKLLGKPGRELWSELRGHSLWPVAPGEKSTYATIIKSKTFSPPSGDKTLVYAKLMCNVETAFNKARRYKLRARVIGVVLRHQDFRHDGLEARLNRPTACTLEVVPLIRRLFERIFLAGCEYRATMIVLGSLENDGVEQFELFENRLKIESVRRATRAVDAVNRKYGRNTLCAGTSLFLRDRPPSTRDARPPRQIRGVPGEDQRRRLAIPRPDFRI